MAATFPLNDEEQRTLHDAELMLEQITEHVADMSKKGDECRNMAKLMGEAWKRRMEESFFIPYGLGRAGSYNASKTHYEMMFPESPR